MRCPPPLPLLPPPPYAVAALEPHIDARTLLLHHDMHHAAYVEALNLALASAPEVLRGKTPEWLLSPAGMVAQTQQNKVEHRTLDARAIPSAGYDLRGELMPVR